MIYLRNKNHSACKTCKYYKPYYLIEGEDLTEINGRCENAFVQSSRYKFNPRFYCELRECEKIEGDFQKESTILEIIKIQKQLEAIVNLLKDENE